MADAYGSRRHSAFTDADLSDRQAAPLLVGSVLEEKLAAFPALRMTLQEQVGCYPDIHLVYAHARRFYDLIPPAGSPVDAEWRERKVAQFRKEQIVRQNRGR